MKSALGLILGVSILATLVGCDGGGDDGTDGPKAVGGSNSSAAGTSSTAGSTVLPSGGSDATAGTSAGGGGGDLPPGVPLTPTDGWVDKASNTLGVQGAMFSYADDTSKMGLTDDFMGSNACIKGTAAKVDLKCTPMAPAMDCYGQFWGAAIGLNLNQPIDMTTMMGSDPVPFDGSAIKGFAFEVSGTMVPAPKDFRFKVEGPSGEFCSVYGTKPIKTGPNTFMLDDLITACWKPVMGAATASTTKSSMLKIAWQVVTNSTSTVPFDFCIANVRALTE
ncbi:MAG TPA: hypothetical protein VHB79_12195 [Polyangiaceae bacterium]|nr:hypothetical protein [Polyangiaceae bacterium]